MAGLPPPPPQGAPRSAHDPVARGRPVGPPIRRPGATLPQPSPPAPPPPEPRHRAPTAAQVVGAVGAVAAAVALTAGVLALVDGADDSLDTAAAADAVTEIVDDSNEFGTVDGCPIDLAGRLEQ